MQTEILTGTVVELSTPFFVGVPGSVTSYEVIVLRLKQEDGSICQLYTATNLQAGFDSVFSEILFSKGKRMWLSVENVFCENLNGLGKNIVSAHELPTRS